MNRSAKVTQGEIARAIRAARAAGGDFCIEITPDGTIRIVPVAPTGPRKSTFREHEDIVL